MLVYTILQAFIIVLRRVRNFVVMMKLRVPFQQASIENGFDIQMAQFNVCFTVA